MRRVEAPGYSMRDVMGSRQVEQGQAIRRRRLRFAAFPLPTARAVLSIHVCVLPPTHERGAGLHALAQP